ncbi:MAG: hypothetical protein IID30_13595, partial [Planctomycetes bacterium]|nr:hypothetical protein [Planctomycetota bacterium]
VLNYAFTAGYTNGIALSYESDNYRMTGLISNGARAGATATGLDTEFAFTGRVEYLAMGNWGQFEDFTSPQGSEQGLMIGAALHYEVAESGVPFAVNTELTIFTLDVSWEDDGYNVYFAWVMSDWNGGPGFGASPDANGFLLQGGYYLDESWEIFARYEAADWDAGGGDDLSIFTIGVNKYIAGHNAKWTTDIGISDGGIDAIANVGTFPTFAAGGGGFGATNFGVDDPITGGVEDGQIVLRTQLQILF